MYRSNFINIFSKIFGNKSKIFISERNTPSKTYEGKSIRSKIGFFLVKYLYPKADLIIPNSKGNSYDLEKNFNISKSKVLVIENPFNLEKIEELSTEKINYAHSDRFIFLMVGRLEVHKNHDLVIKNI